MKLFSVHCGFYSQEIGSGIYESHINLYVVAQSFDEAKVKVKALEEFKAKRMHIDGIQELECIQGYRIQCEELPEAKGKTQIHIKNHRDLAPFSAGA